MDANVTVDLGSNITGLIQQLATQLGMTAEKVFPWYVKQVYMEGISTLYLISGYFTIGLILLAVGWLTIKKNDILGGVSTFIGAIILMIVLMVSCIEIPDAIAKVYNPEKTALTMMIRDISLLRR